MEQTFNPPDPIVLIDDEPLFLNSVALILRSAGYNHIIKCINDVELFAALKEYSPSCVLLDLIMPNKSGLELLPEILTCYPHVPVIMATAIHETDKIVEFIKLGAFNYLVKPIDDIMLLKSIRLALEFYDLKNENVLLKKHLLAENLVNPAIFSAIITQDRMMKSLFKYIETIARNSFPVLITGETGVGKELIAQSIHQASQRSGKFVPINTAGIDDTLFSDLLFGHHKGSFTSADKPRKGILEEAAHGTLFLDEIGDLSYISQSKLLRLLQDGTYYPLGSDTQKYSATRIIAATHVNLMEAMNQGKFRQDLFFRLQVHHIDIPPLRARRDDIPLLIDFFTIKAAQELKLKKLRYSDQLVSLLMNYSFPGNIRELQSFIFDAASQQQNGVLSLAAIKVRIKQTQYDYSAGEVQENFFPTHSADNPAVIFREKLPSLKELENQLIEEALARCNGNQTLAAKLIGMKRTALNNRLNRRLLR